MLTSKKYNFYGGNRFLEIICLNFIYGTFLKGKNFLPHYLCIVRMHMHITLMCNEHPGKPFFYKKSGVCRGIHYFSYFGSKTEIVGGVLVRTVSSRQF